MNKQYPYKVKFVTTTDYWYNNKTNWEQISNWLNKNIGRNWNYNDGYFLFETEKHKLWFMLRWL